MKMRILTSEEASSLRWALSLLRVDKWRFIGALLLASLGIGSSIALGATSAWLIARASQMPPVLVLSVAATSVRLFGVSRALLRYVQRLISHRVALEGMDHLRLSLYDALASSDLGRVISLRRGDLLARMGSDVDEVGDFIVKSVLPAGVAAIVGCATVGALAFLSPGAAVILALC
ncbi:MAG: thiol reductant ABC exporter subunit CydC, partial [Actinomyces sp.]|nr:thiol reductant ABC exporter subunit CydC [Actinomyces sp.]